MSLSSSIAKNTFIHTLGKFSASGIGLIIVALITRYLGAEGFGYYTTIFSYLFFFATAGDLGLYLIAINELGRSQEKDKETIYSHIFTLRFLSGIFFMIVADSLIWFFPYNPAIKLGTLIISISVLTMMVDQVVVAIFQEQMKTKFAALAEFLGKVLTLILIYLAIKSNLSIIYLLWATTLGLIFHAFFNLFFARKFLHFNLSYHKETWLKILKNSWPIATYLIFSMIYFKADTIILSLYHPQSTVGLYGASYKILEVLITLPAIFMGLVSPHLSRAWAENNFSHFKAVYQKAFDLLSILVWPMIFSVLVLAQPMMAFIAGSEFLPAAPIFQILIIATGIIFLAHLSTFSIVAINKQKTMMKFYIIAAIIALILYFIFIPKYSYWAASLITVAVESFILICSWLMIKKQTGIKINLDISAKSFLASLIMAIVISLTNLNLFANIAIAIITYFSCLWLFGVMRKEMVSEFLRKE